MTNAAVISMKVENLAPMMCTDVFAVGYNALPLMRMFSFHPLNREVNRKNINQIKSEICKNHYMSICEVSNLSLSIIDGQNRYRAIMELWEAGLCTDVPFCYRLVDCATEEDERKLIIALNNARKGWGQSDFMDSAEKNGSDAVTKLKMFAATHELCYGKGEASYSKIACLMFGHRSALNAFKEDNYANIIITDEMIATADACYNEIVEFADLMGMNLSANFQGMASGWFLFHKDRLYTEVFGNFNAKGVAKLLNKNKKCFRMDTLTCNKAQSWYNDLRFAALEIKEKMN